MEQKIESSEYVVFARKYRPNNFKALIGQDHVVATLQNAISTKQIAQAYIFCGIRGVGKTTLARVLSANLNCTDNTDQDACGECQNCVDIINGNHVDVIEFDAASRTGVNDIRDIIDNAIYGPTLSKYKIYIIDEVHMLSNSAFNALLKTLEEPPQYLKFIFATTEIKKIPLTVLSRCQRFDLKRVEISKLIKHFNYILQQEQVNCSEQDLLYIAQLADGSVRDGLSLLEQSIIYGNGKDVDLSDLFGIMHYQSVIKLFKEIVSGNSIVAIEQIRYFYNLGVLPESINQNLLRFCHTLSCFKISDDIVDENFNLFVTEETKQFAQKLSFEYLSRVWQILLKTIEEIKNAKYQLSILEMSILKIIYISDLPSPQEVINQLYQQQDSDINPIKLQNDIDNSDLCNDLTKKDIIEDVNIKALLLDFTDLIALVEQKNELVMLFNLQNNITVIKYDHANLLIELIMHKDCPATFCKDLYKFLFKHSGKKWTVNKLDPDYGDSVKVINQSLPDKPALNDQAFDSEQLVNKNDSVLEVDGNYSDSINNNQCQQEYMSVPKINKKVNKAKISDDNLVMNDILKHFPNAEIEIEEEQ